MKKYNGFQVISIEYTRKQRKKFKPINIIYKPTKHIEIERLCYFSDDISKAYTNLYSKPNQIRRAHKCYQCYYCNKFFLRPEKHKSHISNCSGAPGVIYNFNNQTLISYQDNFCAKGDIPFVISFDFETTAPTDNGFDPEQKKVFFVSYVMIAAFHPELKLSRIVIQRSYAHSTEHLTSLNYFTQEQINFIDHTLLKMFKNMAFDFLKENAKTVWVKCFVLKMHWLK